jgi:biotin carboxyl carrier protein
MSAMKLRVKLNDQTYEVEVGDLSARPITAVVDGETFEIWPEEAEETPAAAPVAAPVSRPAAPAPAPRPVAAPVAAAPVAAGAGTIVAPLPGVVTAIKVHVGDTVKQGQEVLSLEAMKMNNAIRATRPGKVSAIHVSVGDQVRHNQPLISFGD